MRFLSRIFRKPTKKAGMLEPEAFFSQFAAALKAGDREKTGRLIAENPGLLNWKNKDGMSVLTVAAATGDVDAAGQLLAAGAYIDSQDGIGMTALMWAVANGHKDMAEYLLDAGANMDIYNKYDGTALTIAEAAGHKDIEELLRQCSGLS